jgi:hypothetical protein
MLEIQKWVMDMESKKVPDKGTGGEGTLGKIQCFKCQEYGHMIRNCPLWGDGANQEN